MRKEIEEMLTESKRRMDEKFAPFNPITGKGSIGERFELYLSDYAIPTQYLPTTMRDIPLVRNLSTAGSIDGFIKNAFAKQIKAGQFSEADQIQARASIISRFNRLRSKHDFAFWAAMYIMITQKGGGAFIKFRLNHPQRKLIARFEEMRLNNMPIRLILLKARQWGGSTATQIYMMWLQVVHEVGLNSLIVAHLTQASERVKAMYVRAMQDYPIELLYEQGKEYNENESKFVGEGRSGAMYRVPQRSCTVNLGSAQSPESCRSGDYSLVHCSEVGLWKETDGKSPEDMVGSACSGVLLKPLTLIVYESTAKGTGTFFHREYTSAKEGTSMFGAMFISWFEIELYSMGFESDEERIDFAEWLYDNRDNDNINSNREACGKYLWWLWTKGASLEDINWYIAERKKYSKDEIMQSEYPTDDIEAFVYSGARVFDRYKVEDMRPSCKPPLYIGDIYGDRTMGEGALENLRFMEDKQGQLWIWNKPETYQGEKIYNRYLVVVDVGGRSARSDWSVIVVFDRLFLLDGGPPVVVAQWYGHIDMDLLAWKAAQIAAYYDEALLVIESNTLESRDKTRDTDGNQSNFILNEIRDVYPNLYARAQSPDAVAQGLPLRYGFHTNMATKPMIISTLVMVIRENLYIERDERCLDEYLCYEKKQNGSYGAIVGKHDDLLMTRAIGLWVCFYDMDMPLPTDIRAGVNNPNKHRRMTEAVF